MRRRRAQPLLLQLIEYVLAWPRLVRIVLIAVFALAVTLALSPLVDYIYSENFFAVETVIVPSLVSAAFGLVMYMAGWWLMVGTVGEKPDARLATIIYLGLGILAVLTVGFLVARGVSLLNLSAST